MHVCMYVCMHVCMDTYIHSCKHIHTNTYAHACRAYTYITYIHTYMYTYMHACMHNFHICIHMQEPVADPGGGQIRPRPPIEVGNGVWPPFRGRKSNGTIVILSKRKNFAPPPYRCRL